MRYQPMIVTYDTQGNATISMKSRVGVLEMYLPFEQQGATPAQTINAVIHSLNDGIEYLEQDMLLKTKGASSRVH